MPYLIGVGVYLLLAWLIGKNARKKGRNFWIWFLLSLLGTPVLAIILLVIFGAA